MRARGELAAIESVSAAVGPAPVGETWIGDDAAAVAPPPGALLLAADTVVEGVHCDLGLVGLDDMGWKAVVANVSDIAAMGGRALHGLVCIAARPRTDLDRLYSGILEAARTYGVAIVGGDMTSSGTTVVSVSITGTTDGRPAVLRRGARPGDAVFVTGPLGGSAAGLAVAREARRSGLVQGPIAQGLLSSHRRPIPRPKEGLAAALGGASAMIDVSDGFSLDLDRLAKASGVGVVIDQVPLAEGASQAEALGGGEDYELIFTAPDPDAISDAFRSAGLPLPLRIGVVSSQPEERVLEGEAMPISGWLHDIS